jgi:hypothetical protein
MTPSTKLNIMFRLTTVLGPASAWSPQDVWHVVVVDARIENVVTGKTIGSDGESWTANDLKSVRFGMIPDSAFDPLVSNCVTLAQGNQAYYVVDLHLASDGTLTGTVALSCFPAAIPITTPQPIVVRKI